MKSPLKIDTSLPIAANGKPKKLFKVKNDREGDFGRDRMAEKGNNPMIDSVKAPKNSL